MGNDVELLEKIQEEYFKALDDGVRNWTMAEIKHTYMLVCARCLKEEMQALRKQLKDLSTPDITPDGDKTDM